MNAVCATLALLCVKLCGHTPRRRAARHTAQAPAAAAAGGVSAGTGETLLERHGGAVQHRQHVEPTRVAKAVVWFPRRRRRRRRPTSHRGRAAAAAAFIRAADRVLERFSSFTVDGGAASGAVLGGALFRGAAAAAARDCPAGAGARPDAPARHGSPLLRLVSQRGCRRRQRGRTTATTAAAAAALSSATAAEGARLLRRRGCVIFPRGRPAARARGGGGSGGGVAGGGHAALFAVLAVILGGAELEPARAALLRGAPRQHLGDVGPPRAEGVVKRHQLPVFRVAPRILLDAGIQVSSPPTHALLVRSSLQVSSNLSPTLAVLLVKTR